MTKLCISFFWLLSVIAVPVLADSSIEDEFSDRKHFLKNRYDDFYKHKEKNRKFKEKLKSGIDEVKESREKWFNRWELARKQRIETRKDPSEREALKQQWEAQQLKLAKEHEKKRRHYLEKREQFRELESELNKVPEHEEFGLKLESIQ